MANPSVKVLRDNTKAVVKSVRRLSLLKLYVGIPDTTATRASNSVGDAQPMQSPENPINNATLAYIHNFGSPARNIPARPFLTIGVADAKQSITDQMAVMAQRALDGNENAVAAGFHALGLTVVNFVRKRLTDGPWKPLSPRTIEARKAARKSGQAGTKPLIDTGKLRQAISYVVRTR